MSRRVYANVTAVSISIRQTGLHTKQSETVFAVFVDFNCTRVKGKFVRVVEAL